MNLVDKLLLLCEWLGWLFTRGKTKAGLGRNSGAEALFLI